MDTNHATTAFAALSQPLRLDAFRLIVAAGPQGLLAGGIAEAMGAKQNTMSTNLAQLREAGLLVSRREGRGVRYAADLVAVQGLAGFLLDECCGGQPELCAPGRPGALGRMEGYAMTDKKNVLFLCHGNSARSLIAETILNAEAGDRFRAFSAGAEPKSGPHPYTIDLLKTLGHDVSGLRSKSWDEFGLAEAPEMDFVFTVCDKAAGATCPVWPGQPMSAHWGVPDPVGAQGNEAEKRLAFSDAYRMLRNRILAFTALPLAALDSLSLKRELDDIGGMVAEERAT
ncbi:helix-turn-helix domain-containing protein [uncultured Maritimibacter sp.]|uniref:arsenate reductase/protein-tyrosine-phosphatase family protein n=1 Tax=uncultured Maritimibacter sp. TaxID=991866 RepID=UPI0025969F6F|nr:helix-turn-helix domain-containing protein [uncultured Maritimibacter sp.]